MPNKAVFVLLDGLQSQYAKEHLGYLEQLSETNRAAKYEVLGNLPSSSRPMYETIFTGVEACEHGVTNNGICRLSNQKHLFELLKQENEKSLACAYYWISELYLSAPFDKGKDIWHEDPNSMIDRGFFYYEDSYPDNHLYSLASSLMDKEDYDFVLIHPMNIDDIGHKYGSDSAQYRNVVRRDDIYLSYYLDAWLQAGYQVIVTADHGMNHDGTHGGTLPIEREVPLVLLGSAFTELKGQALQIKQTEICGLCCELLGLSHHKALPQGVYHGND